MKFSTLGIYATVIASLLSTLPTHAQTPEELISPEAAKTDTAPNKNSIANDDAETLTTTPQFSQPTNGSEDSTTETTVTQAPPEANPEGLQQKTDEGLAPNIETTPDAFAESDSVDLEPSGTGPEQQAASAPAPEPALPHDLSPWGMFMQADWVVKTVMIGLVLASLATWTVLIAKTRELRIMTRRQRRTLNIVTAADRLRDAHRELETDGNASTELSLAAAQEMHRSAKVLADAEGLKERVASALERVEADIGRKTTKGTSILATIGSTAPFVGLFGTVWGIMNSFIGISKAQTTNLAVVAPGIAEALLATALGLVAAIPAVVIYNHFARQIAAYRALLADTSAATLRLVSRDLSRYAITGEKPAMES